MGFLLKWIFKFLVKILFVGRAAVELAAKEYRGQRDAVDDRFHRAEEQGEEALDMLKKKWHKMEDELTEKAEAFQSRVMSNGATTSGSGKASPKTSSHEQGSEMNRLKAELAELRVELRELRRHQASAGAAQPVKDSPTAGGTDPLQEPQE